MNHPSERSSTPRTARAAAAAAVLGAVLLVVASPSCSTEPTCEDLCERQAACPDTPADCVEGCREGGERSEAAGCPETYEEMNRCLDEADDICSPPCDAEIGAFFTCTCPGGACLETE